MRLVLASLLPKGSQNISTSRMLSRVMHSRKDSVWQICYSSAEGTYSFLWILKPVRMVLSRLCRPQLWAVIQAWPQFCLWSLPGNSEKNQFLGLNMLYNKPIPSIFKRKRQTFNMDSELVARTLALVFICFSQSPSEIFITYIFHCGHWWTVKR